MAWSQRIAGSFQEKKTKKQKKVELIVVEGILKDKEALLDY